MYHIALVSAKRMKNCSKMASPGKQSAYKGFVDNFIATMNSAVSGDGVYGGHSPYGAENANHARFRLGGDDGLYLTAGITLLHVDDANSKLPLAPSSLYSSDVIEATKLGLIKGKSYENIKRREDQKDELARLFRVLAPLAYNSFNNGELVPEEWVQLAKVLPEARTVDVTPDSDLTDEYNKLSLSDQVLVMKEMAKFCFEVLEKHPEIVPDVAESASSSCTEPGSCAPTVLSSASSSAAYHPVAMSAAGANPVTPTMARATQAGVFHYVGPHEPAVTDGPEASIDYKMPLGAEYALKYAKMLTRCKNFGTVTTEARTIAREHMKRTEYADAVKIEAKMALDGKLTVAEKLREGKRPGALPRWEAKGQHAESFASAALLGHTIGRLKDVASTDKSLSHKAKRLLLQTASGLKIDQLCHMRIVNAAVSTGAAPPFPDRPADNGDDVWERDFRAYMQALLDRTLYYAFVPTDAEVKAELEAALPSGSAEERREGLWTELRRDMAISTDRVWMFIRTLSGLIGESADTLITTADEASQRAAKEVQAQRRQIADRVAQLQSRIVETLIGGLLKDSSLQLSTDASNAMVVVDGETAKQIRDLASGESGRPFFEANVALRNLTDPTKNKPKSLVETIQGFTTITETLKSSLERELLPNAGVAGASLAELAMPRNSYFVKLRDDTAAAIKAAFDRWESERGIHGGIRHIYLWELVEGADPMLSSRFAEFVGHLLVQNRTTTGVSAIYTSRQQVAVNAAQARVSLARLLNQAAYYVGGHPAAPDFSTNEGRQRYFDAFARKRGADELSWSSAAGGAVPSKRLVSLAGWHGGLVM